MARFSHGDLSHVRRRQHQQANDAWDYFVKFRAENYQYEISQYDIPQPRTSAQFPKGTLLEGDSYEMLLIARREALYSVERVNFQAAPAPLGPALMARFPGKYLAGVMKMGTQGYQFHTEVRPQATGYRLLLIAFPSFGGNFTLFESPLAANPFELSVDVNIDASMFLLGAYDVSLFPDTGSSTILRVTTPSQYPADPSILAPTEGQSVPPGYLETWNAGTGLVPNAIMRAVEMDRWDLSGFVEPSVTQAAIPPFGPTSGSSEEGKLVIMNVAFTSSGDHTGFTGSAARTNFRIRYSNAADKKAWTLYP
jgi:hypothetical protein